MIQITNPRIQNAIVLYKSGKTLNSICKELHLDGTTLRRFLIQEGILRSRGEAIRNGKTEGRVKDDAFDVLTSECLYWIGFLYADGHIEKDRPKISLTLSEKDKHHLEKFNQFISNGTLAINDVTQDSPKNYARGQVNFEGKYWRITFSSKQIYNRLKEFGFTHLKTYSIVPKEYLAYSRDFWRGCIDGDGWVCTTGDKRANGKYDYAEIGLSGTQETCLYFLHYIENINIKTDAQPRKRKDANVYQIDIHNVPAKKVLDLLYKDATIYLDRKYQKYLEIINNNK